MKHLFFFIIFTGILTGQLLWNPGALALLDYQALHIISPSLSHYGGITIPGIFGSLFGVDLGSKILFLLILASAYILGIYMSREVARMLWSSSRWWMECGMGIFFLSQPFAYERLMTQPLVYLGIVFLGYTIIALMRFHHNPSRKQSIILGILWGISLYFLPHGVYMLILIYGMYAFVLLLKGKISPLFLLFLSGICTLMINIGWILSGGITHEGTEIITSFWNADLQAFAGNAVAPINTEYTHMLGYGFWAARYAPNLISVSDISGYWYIFGSLFLLLALLWYIWAIRVKKVSILLPLWGIIGVISLLFGFGIASPLSESLTYWMHTHMPFWNGYREPQKWIGLWMILFGIGLTISLHIIQKYCIRQSVYRLWWTTLLLLCLFYFWSPGTFFGFQGQLRTTLYPQDIQDFREQVLRAPLPGRIAVFPWHNYYGCQWTGRPSIADPAIRLLYPYPVISSNAIEVENLLYANTYTPETQAVKLFLSTRDPLLLKAQNIRFIFAMKNCGDIAQYAWLNSVCHLQKDSHSFALYQCF